MIIMVLVAGYVLTNRAADFAKAEPSPRGRPPISAPPLEGSLRTTRAKSAARRTLACIP
jgi:hypothetical protein